MLPIKRVLVPTDFSKPAEAALQWGRTLAKECGAELHLLHVVAEPYLYPWGSEAAAFPLNEVLTQSDQAARQQLDRLASTGGDPDVRVVTATSLGTPVDRIIDYITSHSIDLVVMGTHGRGVVEHLLLGSVAERMVRRSPVPVLTVRQ